MLSNLPTVLQRHCCRELTLQRKLVAARLRSTEVRGPRLLCVVNKKQQLHMGNYWLLKTEPDCWSWDNQIANKGLSVWDGVRNHQAQKAMRNMVEGDLCFFYHTGKLKEACGIVRVVKTFYPDPTDDTGKWGAVDVQEVLQFKKPVTLAQMKEDEEIVDFLMFRQPRLSVVPVEEAVWKRICSMGEVEPPSLDSSDHIVKKVQATNGTKKRAAVRKIAPSEKQDRKKSTRGGKKIDDDEEESEEPSKVTKKHSSQQQEKRRAGVKEDRSRATTATTTASVKSKTGANGNDVGENAQPPEVGKKRAKQSKPAPVEEDPPSAKAIKKRASEAKSASAEKQGGTKPSKPSKRPSKKPKKEDET